MYAQVSPSSAALPLRVGRNALGLPRGYAYARPLGLNRRRGMGDVTPTAADIGRLASQGAAATGAILAGLASPSLAVLSPAFAAAGPIGAAVAGLTALGFAIASQFQGCGQTCIAATQIANQVGAYLTQNLNTYMAAPIHYASMQAAALNNYDFAWAALQKACGDPTLGQAGVRCVTDRQAGACTWKASPGGWSQDSSGKWSYQGYGPAGSGTACWNWFIGMRDPIANDPTVVPDPVAGDSSTLPASPAASQLPAGSGLDFSGSSSFPWLLAAAAGLAIFALAD